MATVVYYHDNCTDGFAAAFVVYKTFGDGPDIKYVPCNYGAKPPDPAEYTSNKVIIVDFSFPLDVMNDMRDKSMHFTWLDHHKTAFEMYGVDSTKPYVSHDETSSIVLDPNRSGALIAFDWFVPAEKRKSTAKLVYYIDDRDRWQFRLSDTREVHAALQLIKPWSFDQWDKLDKLFFKDHTLFEDFVETGRTALKVQDNHVQSAVKNAPLCKIKFTDSDGNDHIVIGRAVNSTVHMSEVGHELCKQSGTYGLVYYIDADGQAKCSLRSEGDYDVSIIAKHYGGGGHRNAAGFSVPVSQLLQFLGKSL